MPEFVWRGAVDLANFQCGRLILMCEYFKGGDFLKLKTKLNYGKN
jgi:hypothetical protein